MVLIGHDEVAASVEDLVRTVTPDVYRSEDLVNWQTVSTRLRAWQDGIEALNWLSMTAHGDTGALAHVLSEGSNAYEVLRTLLALRGAIGFADGRELPTQLSRKHDPYAVAELLQDVGVWEVLLPEIPVEPMAKIALVARSADRRRFNARGRLEQWVEEALRVALDEAGEETGLTLELAKPGFVPGLKLKTVRASDHVVTAEGTPFAVVNTVFQTSSGGRQQRDLAQIYPALQEQLDELPAGLVLIVDGRGIREAPRHVLEEMVGGVASCMTLRQAQKGVLAAALIDLAKRGGVRPALDVPLDRLINSALQSKLRVEAQDIPVNLDRGRIALASYETDHPELDLTLSPDGTSLEWKRIDTVSHAARLPSIEAEDAARSALDVFAQLMEASLSEPSVMGAPMEGSHKAVLEKQGDPVLPARTLAVSTADTPTATALRSIAIESARQAPEAKLAVMLTPTAPAPEKFATLQATLAATVVVLDYQDLLLLAQSSEDPRDGFVSAVLERADVTKVSPFVLRSVTPERMFFGRAKEQATLVSTLAANSVALLGGRRIGKTSLLRRAESWLRAGDFFPVFGDCQNVGSWEEFGRLARRAWNCEVPIDFKPPDLFLIVEQLTARSGSRLVFLLDEIDHLLSRDESIEFEGVEEPFFRTCRAISQQGLAQFVFAGERMIAKKLWDPHSPHWNFYRTLQLRQLEREAAELLLVTPLKSLGVELLREEDFRTLAWRFTSGHPLLVQLLGDRLVDLVSNKPRGARGRLTPDDLQLVAEKLDYVEQYLETYWGQATDLEKLVSIVVAMGQTVPGEVAGYVNGYYNLPLTEDAALSALRVLDLYGVVDQERDGYCVRLEWFSDALGWYGGAQRVGQGYADKLSSG